MVLDIFMFRKEKGGMPDLLRESQRRRCKDPFLVDAVIKLDEEWRQQLVQAENLKKAGNFCSKMFGEKKAAKVPLGENLPISDELRAKAATLSREDLKDLNGTQLIAFSKEIGGMAVKADQERASLEEKRDAAIKKVGNIVHESCAPTDDEDQNEVVRTWGEKKPTTEDTWHHVDLMGLLGMDCGSSATAVAGNRAFFLKGDLVRLQFGLINYALNFLIQKGCTPVYPPFFMNKSVMASVAELADFDEALYHVAGDGEDKYLIATSEQPICAYHANNWYQESDLKTPIKYAGVSTCFRKEAGAHGKDTLGIFRVHQFDKIEQFTVCQPRDGESWQLLENMIENSEAFYQSIGLPYRVVQIVGGALNLAAAKKYDLEAWFPASQTYRELVSCSNCTDYQSRAINCRYGQSNKGTAKENVREFPHMLNGTLCAVTRTMCCICENFQTEEGVVIPEVLRPYVGGMEIMKFSGPKVKAPAPEEKKKKQKAAK